MSLFGSARPAIVGHRGAPRRAPENSLESFLLAAQEGAHWVELDVRRTADGGLAVIHDPVDVRGRAVVAQSAAELEAGGVWALPALLDGLPPDLGIDVELKNFPGEADYDERQQLGALVAAALRPWLGRRPLLASSFNPLALQALRAELPALPLGLLTAPGLALDSGTELALELGVDAVLPHATAPDLAAAEIAAARARGLAVMVWTVDDVAEARRLADAGVDALCTNDPAAMAVALAT